MMNFYFLLHLLLWTPSHEERILPVQLVAAVHEKEYAFNEGTAPEYGSGKLNFGKSLFDIRGPPKYKRYLLTAKKAAHEFGSCLLHEKHNKAFLNL